MTRSIALAVVWIGLLVSAPGAGSTGAARGPGPAATALCTQSTEPPPGVRSAWEGVYTEEQARRGRRLFEMYCASCHTVDEFAQGYQTVYDLFVSRTEMPEPSPGVLSPQEYVDLVAYLLEANELPPGKDELKADPDLLKRIRIDPKPRSR